MNGHCVLVRNNDDRMLGHPNPARQILLNLHTSFNQLTGIILTWRVHVGTVSSAWNRKFLLGCFYVSQIQ